MIRQRNIKPFGQMSRRQRDAYIRNGYQIRRAAPIEKQRRVAFLQFNQRVPLA